MNIADIAAIVNGAGGGGGGTTDPYAGYDLVLTINDDDSSAPWVVLKGDYNATKTKLDTAIPEPCLALIFHTRGGACDANWAHHIAYSDLNDYIVISVFSPDVMVNYALIWNPDGSVEWGD